MDVHITFYYFNFVQLESMPRPLQVYPESCRFLAKLHGLARPKRMLHHTREPVDSRQTTAVRPTARALHAHSCRGGGMTVAGR